MTKLPLILLRREELTLFCTLLPLELQSVHSEFVQNHTDLFYDDSAKVIRGSLESSIALSHMGLFFDGKELFLVDVDKSAMCIDVGTIFHSIVMGKGSDPIVKAATVKGQLIKETLIFDFSAGTLRDSLHFLKAGFRVVAFERHLIVYLLLNSALKNASTHHMDFLPGLELIFGDPTFLSMDEMKRKVPDVVYYDPMFEGTLEKSAKPRKEMLLFHKLFNECYSFQSLFSKECTNESTNEAVLSLALELAVKKVIVKRAPKALAIKKPTYELLSKTVRFDVYDVSLKKI